MNHIVSFTDREATSVPRAGGKGANLAKLTAAGLSVPPGFVVSTSAYTAFIEANDLQNRIAGKLASLDYNDMAGLESVTAEIRAAIESAPFPADLRDEVSRAYTALGPDAYVAVRSSGTAEDTAGASFAGLHETYLDIRELDDVVSAVQRCWASMWSARATAYRHNQGFDHSGATIAVVVQTMVESDVSGVMFTANPSNFRTDEIVVNASWGLGEAIVSSLVNPDEFIVDADQLSVRQLTIGAKERQVVRTPRAQGGTVAVDVPEKQRGVASLSDAEVVELCRLSRKIEAAYGDLPQDIEWALKDGNFYVLQARPITGANFRWEEEIELAAQNTPAPKGTVWTRRWAESYWTGGISPLFYSVRARHYRKSVNNFLELMGFDSLMEQPQFKYYRGTVYWNCNFCYDYARLAFPAQMRAGLLDFVPPQWHKEAMERPLDFFKYVRMLISVNSSSLHSVYRWRRTQRSFIDGKVNEATAPSNEALRNMSDRELERYSFQQEELQRQYCDNLWIAYNLIFPTILGAFAMLLERWYQGENALILQDLISGNPKQTLQQVETHEQYELTQIIRNSPDLLRSFHENQGPAFFDKLNESEDGRAFKERYEAFIRDHGHRGAAERDIYYKRRGDDPWIDYAAFGAHLKETDPTPPQEIEKNVAARREAAVTDVLTSLEGHPFGGLLKKAFWVLYEQVLDFLWIREDSRHYADRISYSKRKAFLEVARRCVERGSLVREDDCFFLTDRELYDQLRRTALDELAQAKIAGRKHDFQLLDSRQASLPLYLQDGVVVDLENTDSAGDGLVGLPMSSGVATGTARVVPDLSQIGCVEKGDILVCNATDPGWSPVFTLIKGLIIETGGMLAHGACLSREHGMPALQLRDAMRIIKDGDQIEIHGDTGQIRIIDDPPDPDREPEPAELQPA